MGGWGQGIALGQLSASDTDNIIGYAGYVYNAEFPRGGLYTVRHRHYSVDLGRWISRDPAGYVDGWSLYEYSSSTPIQLRDPSGLSPDINDLRDSYLARVATLRSRIDALRSQVGGDYECLDELVSAEAQRQRLERLVKQIHLGTGADLDALTLNQLQQRIMILETAYQGGMTIALTPVGGWAIAAAGKGLQATALGRSMISQYGRVTAVIGRGAGAVGATMARAASPLTTAIGNRAASLASSARGFVAGLRGSSGTIGAQGEQAAIRALQRKGYTDIVQIQNRSGHGIDIAARNRSGSLRFFEVKSHRGVGVARLSPAQRDIGSFVKTRLDRAAAGTGHWRNVDSTTRAAAASMRMEIQLGAQIRGAVLNVDRATNLFPRISAFRW